MIEYLQGVLSRRAPTEVVVECAGIGYRVQISLNSYAKLPVSGTVRILVHTHVTDVGQRLFGFLEESERELFRLLQSVRGVGPSIALTLLSHESPERLVQRLRNGDAKGLTQIKGIGKKTAERLILELKDRLPELSAVRLPGAEQQSTLINALLSLGFTQTEADARSQSSLKALGAEASIEALLRAALRGAARSATDAG